jgi:hypothetical protein
MNLEDLRCPPAFQSSVLTTRPRLTVRPSFKSPCNFAPIQSKNTFFPKCPTESRMSLFCAVPMCQAFTGRCPAGRPLRPDVKCGAPGLPACTVDTCCGMLLPWVCFTVTFCGMFASVVLLYPTCCGMLASMVLFPVFTTM